MNKKVVLVGTPGSGITTFLFRVSYGYFPEEYTPSVMDVLVRQTSVGGRDLELRFWDTACHEDYNRLRPLAYPETDVFVLCYSFQNPLSMNEVATKWYPEVRGHRPQAKIVVLGLRNSDINAGIPEVIQGFLSSHNCPHFFADSTTGNGIEEFIVGVAGLCVSNLRPISKRKAHNNETTVSKKDFCRV